MKNNSHNYKKYVELDSKSEKHRLAKCLNFA